MKKAALAVIFALVGTAWAGPEPTKPPPRNHEPLRLKNTFQNPEDVVRYYCARDASGFVFTGLMDSERRAFTSWKTVPDADGFFVAKKYDVRKARYPTKSPDVAEVDVEYELTGQSDAHGTYNPAPSGHRTVTFSLIRQDRIWRISGF